MVCGRNGPQFLCQTYAEAEARALSYAQRANATAWYVDSRGLQLLASFKRARE